MVDNAEAPMDAEGALETSEYERLAEEMAEDAKWQLQLFTFAVTSAAAALTLLSPEVSPPTAAAPAAPLATTPATPIPHGLFFLAPLFVVIPSSLMILNRARTRNRKAAFIIAYLDPIRLSKVLADEPSTLEAVERLRSVPWETALNVFQRGRKIHIAPALVYMFGGFFVIEVLCLALSWSSLFGESWWRLYAVGTAVSWLALVWHRTRRLFCLRHDESIQGFVRFWLANRDYTRKEWPGYLCDWITGLENRGQLK